jgi:hypothetical protein
MSFRVLVIPEDFRKDQYILQPVIAKMMEECGKPNAIVRVCTDPLLGGIDRAMNRSELAAILSRYKGMIDLFLLCVDRDGQPGRRSALDKLEEWASTEIGPNKRFFGVDAWQELEVWVLAGHNLPAEWPWADVRSEIHPKEKYFTPFAESQGVADQPGEGRRTLAEAAVSRYGRMKQLCPEDFAALEYRITDWVKTT